MAPQIRATTEEIVDLNPITNRTCKLTAVEDAQARRGIGRQWISRKPGAWLLVAGAYGLGGSGMLAWLLFLLVGPLIQLDSGFSTTGRLLTDALLCLLFFVQHSIMVRQRFRLWLTRSVRVDFHGALYATVSGACLLTLVCLWQTAGPPLWTPPQWIRWLMTALFLSAGIGAWWGSRALGEFDALGVQPAIRAFGRDRSATPMDFKVRGPYRWVRHPLYLCSLIIIWTGSVFTLDRLLHNGLWTIWIIIGATMEEQDLTDCFGDAYRAYRKKVPMLLPKSLRPRLPDDRDRPPGDD
ncbi:hypothetical protein DSCO28_56870 [Desulfosarcina ovata subsp. sediminis]|uniref:NnrU domain-containing protein n=1 Tax=Desulfosarcina ovata subsp. sediminis TaxID=885957 RepID=A0A5K7ZYD6_9BACT|nr:isoprenylcysteine carboxylmethyltransferase family protein [Desulfosarcina ovata]BBO85121.1 hypothetical protein DSCO28_56870 [Desulfosarcina ovata subsp. sediminis]